MEYKSIIYYFKLRKSGKAKADFGGGVSIYNLLFQDMEIREAKADFGRGVSMYNILFHTI